MTMMMSQAAMTEKRGMLFILDNMHAGKVVKYRSKGAITSLSSLSYSSSNQPASKGS